jgi:uncharacterized membrane protein
MTKHSQKNKQDLIDAKKAAVLGTGKKNRLSILLAAGAVILVAAGAYLAMAPSDGLFSSAQEQRAANAAGDHVVHPAEQFADGQARHFEFQHGKMTIRYFIIKSSDGVIRAAFDACDVCWPAGKGYYQDGDVMVCRNCGRRFASVLVNEVQGGCNPAPLHRSLQGDQVVIRVQDILEGQRFFDFSGKA